LFTIGREKYLAFPDSSGWFLRDFRFSKYSRLKTKSSLVFAYGTVTSFGPSFQRIRLTNEFVTLLFSPKLFELKNVLILLPPSAPHSRDVRNYQFSIINFQWMKLMNKFTNCLKIASLKIHWKLEIGTWKFTSLEWDAHDSCLRYLT